MTFPLAKLNFFFVDEDDSIDDSMQDEEAPDESSQDIDGGNADEASLDVDGNEVCKNLFVLNIPREYEFSWFVLFFFLQFLLILFTSVPNTNSAKKDMKNAPRKSFIVKIFVKRKEPKYFFFNLKKDLKKYFRTFEILKSFFFFRQRGGGVNFRILMKFSRLIHK